jgi:drug/metabolite transporter (DMT)-like permease
VITALLVTARILANPVANVFQKKLAERGASPTFIIGATHALLTAVCLILLWLRITTELASEFWANMVICALLAVAGNVLLVYALEAADLSMLGPINAYKALVGLLIGMLLIREVPTAVGVAGVLLILAGSYFVIDREPSQQRANAFVLFFRHRGIQLRVAALVLSATEAVFLKKALLLSSPLLTFIFWSILGLPIAAILVAVLVRRDVKNELVLLRSQWRMYLAAAFTTGVMQLTTLFTFRELQVGYSLALFQLSAIVSVFLGHRYFQERNIGRRLIGSAIMAAGAVLIVATGG